MDLRGLLLLALGAGALAWVWEQAIGGGVSVSDTNVPDYPPSLPSPVLTSGGTMVDITSKIQEFAQAIAHAEGFGVPGAVPTIFHNPGDLGPGDTGIAGSAHGGSVVSQLPDDATGWAMLYRKVGNIFAGKSNVYSTSMTIREVAQRYAGDWQNWANNVAADLGVSVDTTLDEWLQS